MAASGLSDRRVHFAIVGELGQHQQDLDHVRIAGNHLVHLQADRRQSIQGTNLTLMIFFSSSTS